MPLTTQLILVMLYLSITPSGFFSRNKSFQRRAFQSYFKLTISSMESLISYASVIEAKNIARHFMQVTFCHQWYHINKLESLFWDIARLQITYKYIIHRIFRHNNGISIKATQLANTHLESGPESSPGVATYMSIILLAISPSRVILSPTLGFMLRAYIVTEPSGQQTDGPLQSLQEIITQL